MNGSLSRWAGALLALAPLLLVVVLSLDAPAVDTDNLNKAREDLLDIHDNRAGLAALVALEILAAGAVVAAAAFLAGRLQKAPALATASVVFAAVAGGLVLATAGMEIALITDVAEAVADGQESSSTLLLGQVLYSVLDTILFIGVLPATGLWVTLASVAMLRSEAFGPVGAYVGFPTGALTSLGALSFAVDVFHAFAGLGALSIIVWSIFLAVLLLRQRPAPLTAEGPA